MRNPAAEASKSRVISWFHSRYCPDCGLAWWLFPPARISGSETLARCIECKRVYELEDVTNEQ